MSADKDGLFNYAGLRKNGRWENFQVAHPKEATVEDTGYDAISREFNSFEEAEIFCRENNKPDKHPA